MFRMDLAQAEQELEDLENVTKTLLEAWEDADAAADRLHGTWAGDAALAHLTSHDLWREDINKLMKALDEMRGALEIARGNYSSAASTNVSMWK